MIIKRQMEIDAELPKIAYVTIPSEEEIENAETDVCFAVDDPLKTTARYYLRTPGENGTIRIAYGPEVGDEDWERYPEDCDWEDDSETGIGAGNRPELVFESSLYDAGFQAGDSFDIGMYGFMVISKTIALCDSYISTDIFDENTNEYEDSLIKERVEKWFENEIMPNL